MHKPPSLPLRSTKNLSKNPTTKNFACFVSEEKKLKLLFIRPFVVLAPQFIVAHSNWYQLIKVKIQTVRTKL